MDTECDEGRPLLARCFGGRALGPTRRSGPRVLPRSLFVESPHLAQDRQGRPNNSQAKACFLTRKRVSSGHLRGVQRVADEDPASARPAEA